MVQLLMLVRYRHRKVTETVGDDDGSVDRRPTGRRAGRRGATRAEGMLQPMGGIQPPVRRIAPPSMRGGGAASLELQHVLRVVHTVALP